MHVHIKLHNTHTHTHTYHNWGTYYYYYYYYVVVKYMEWRDKDVVGKNALRERWVGWSGGRDWGLGIGDGDDGKGKGLARPDRRTEPVVLV